MPIKPEKPFCLNADGANAGHAAYISAERQQGHIDPGAEAIARRFERVDMRKPSLLAAQ